MVEYTKEDMIKYAQMSKEGSIPNCFLPVMNYDPEAFKSFIFDQGLYMDYHLLFVITLEEIPLLINKGETAG